MKCIAINQRLPNKLMKQSFSILIVEDEAAIRTGLVDVFIYHGYHVEYAEDGKVGLGMALTGQFDLILLDVMLPSMNGFDICRLIREQDKDQAIIMLTAKTAEDDIVQGLSLGADDYVAKPFSVTQLVLRVQAVLRRLGKIQPTSYQIKLEELRIIDTQNLCVEIEGEQTRFTRKEMQLIEYLYSHHQRPVSREELLAEVWGYDPKFDIETRTVDIHIAKIRKKIERKPKEPRFLTTVRGAGYRLLFDQQSPSQ